VRAYSFAQPAWVEGPVPLVFDDVPEGVGTQYLKSLLPGDSVEVGAVAGKFVLPDPLPAGIVFLARFTGVVPVHCILKELERLGNPPSVTLISGAPTSGDLVFHEALTELAERASWFTYHPVSLDGGRDELSVLDKIPHFGHDVVPMVSGVRAFTQPVRACLMERYGYERRAVRVENYD
jgi:ferredoxin-NADP reductase